MIFLHTSATPRIDFYEIKIQNVIKFLIVEKFPIIISSYGLIHFSIPEKSKKLTKFAKPGSATKTPKSNIFIRSQRKKEKTG